MIKEYFSGFVIAWLVFAEFCATLYFDNKRRYETQLLAFVLIVNRAN